MRIAAVQLVGDAADARRRGCRPASTEATSRSSRSGKPSRVFLLAAVLRRASATWSGPRMATQARTAPPAARRPCCRPWRRSHGSISSTPTVAADQGDGLDAQVDDRALRGCRSRPASARAQQAESLAGSRTALCWPRRRTLARAPVGHGAGRAARRGVRTACSPPARRLRRAARRRSLAPRPGQRRRRRRRSARHGAQQMVIEWSAGPWRQIRMSIMRRMTMLPMNIQAPRPARPILDRRLVDHVAVEVRRR